MEQAAGRVRTAVMLLLAALTLVSCGRGSEPPAREAQKLAAETPGLRATFYNDLTLDRPVLNRTDGSIDFNWGLGSPGTGVGVDGFSARWQGQVQPLYTETYTFITRADDGVRLWVNGQLIINNWVNQAETERTGTIALVAGARYNIRLEYFDSAEDGIVQLSWRSARQARQVIPQSQLFVGPEPAESAPSGPAGLNASFFQGTALSGSPLLTRVDANADFDWGSGSPGTGVPTDGFSARWQGQVQARFGETYTFITRADDGVRLWVNGQQVINNWVNQSLTERTGTIALTAGTWYDIRVEYFDSTGGASLQLLWQSTSQPRQVIPSWRLSPGCNNNRLDTLAVNGGFECSLDGWTEGYFRNPGWGTGAITLERVGGAGGSVGAVRVVVPGSYPADANPRPPEPYYAGAHVAMKEELPAGSWIRLVFDARRVAGGSFLSVERPFGGSVTGGGVPLTDSWETHSMLMRLDHPTNSLIFNLHQLGFPYRTTGGEFLLDNLSITKVPACTDVPAGSKIRELVCFPPQTGPGQALRINFNAHSLSGTRSLRATAPRTGDIGDNTMVTLGTTSTAYQVTVRNQNANQPLSLRLLPYYYYSEPHAIAGAFVASRPSFTVVAECNNTPGATNPGVANGGFECDRSFWSSIYWNDAERTFRGDVLSLARVAGAGGSLGALRVTVPSTFPAGVDPNGQLHMSGAAVHLKPTVPTGFVRVSFDARRISGSANLSIQRIWGGAAGISYTQLNDQWNPYTLTFRLDYPTDGLTFTTWTGSQPIVAAGVFEIDNLRVAPALTVPVEVSVTSASGVPMAGREVNAFQGTQPFGAKATTDASGRVRLLVPAGSYRFGASDGTITFYSGATDHCGVTDTGGCRAASIVFGGDPANVVVTPAAVTPGTLVSVSWSGIPGAAATDTVGLYLVGASGASYLTRQSTEGTAAGSARLSVPATAAAGNYHARVVRDNGTTLATSNTFSVATSPCSGVSDGTSCANGNACVQGETCQGQVCAGGTPVSCNDGVVCTEDTCDVAVGCRHTPHAAGTPFPDNNLCNGQETCDGTGTLLAGRPPDCDDSSSCTIDSCVENEGCHYEPASVGSRCDNGTVCDGEDRCDGLGLCTGTGFGAPVCDDGDPCTAEVCDPNLGCIANPIAQEPPSPTCPTQACAPGECCPSQGASCNVIPHTNCIVQREGDWYTAVFGYTNPQSFDLTVPVHASNSISVDHLALRPQPTLMLPGVRNAAFLADFRGTDGGVSWTLSGQTALASPTTLFCPAATCADGPGIVIDGVCHRLPEHRTVMIANQHLSAINTERRELPASGHLCGNCVRSTGSPIYRWRAPDGRQVLTDTRDRERPSEDVLEQVAFRTLSKRYAFSAHCWPGTVQFGPYLVRAHEFVYSTVDDPEFAGLNPLLKGSDFDWGCVQLEPGNGTIPVTRLRNVSTGAYVLTTDDSERDDLVTRGWTNQGVKFWAWPATYRKPIFRFRKQAPADDDDLLTGDRLAGAAVPGYAYAGTAFFTQPVRSDLNSVFPTPPPSHDPEGPNNTEGPCPSGMGRLHRLRNISNGSNTYSSSRQEIDALVADGQWTEEEVLGCVAFQSICDTVPLMKVRLAGSTRTTLTTTAAGREIVATTGYVWDLNDGCREPSEFRIASTSDTALSFAWKRNAFDESVYMLRSGSVNHANPPARTSSYTHPMPRDTLMCTALHAVTQAGALPSAQACGATTGRAREPGCCFLLGQGPTSISFSFSNPSYTATTTHLFLNDGTQPYRSYDGAARNVTLTGLSPGTSYSIRLQAVNATGASDLTPPWTVSTLSSSGTVAPGAGSGPEQFRDEAGNIYRRIGPATEHDVPPREGDVAPGFSIQDIALDPALWRAPGGDEALMNYTEEQAASVLNWRVHSMGDEYSFTDATAIDIARKVRAQIASGRPVELSGMQSRASGLTETGTLRLESSDEEEVLAVVTEPDGREPMNEQSEFYPYNNVGLLQETSARTAQRRCTCFKFLSHDICATAAHCLWSHEVKDWLPARVIVFAAPSGKRLIVPSRCYERFVPESYIKGHPDRDYGAIRFRGGRANCPDETFDVGYYGWKPVADGGTPRVRNLGYPGPLRFGWTAPTLTYQSLNAGALAPLNRKGLLLHRLDTDQGQSGSPLFDYIPLYDPGPVRVMGIHTAPNTCNPSAPGCLQNIGMRVTRGVVTHLSLLGGRRE